MEKPHECCSGVSMTEEERIKMEKMKKLMKKMDGGEMQSVIDVNDGDFQERVIQQSSDVPVIVDFWSQRCPPCLVLGPVLEKLANEYEGKFILAKANVDSARSTAINYGVMSIPSVKLFRNGKIVDEFVGAIPEPMVRSWIDKNIPPE